MKIFLRTWGPLATFTRPETRAERSQSYKIMTPSAARGILESIYTKIVNQKQQMEYKIRRIYVLNPIKTIRLASNGVRFAMNPNWDMSINDPGRKPDVEIGEKAFHLTNESRQHVAVRIQHTAEMLTNVDYIIEADLVAHDGNQEKHNNIFTRRAQSGRCWQVPYFGIRECIADWERVDSPEPYLERAAEIQDIDFGFVFYGFDYKNKIMPMFFRARMINGIVEVPENPLVATKADPNIARNPGLVESLVNLYDRLENSDPNLPHINYNNQKVSHVIVLRDDGTIDNIEELDKPLDMWLPGAEVRTGTKVLPHMCWDSLEYLFGFTNKSKEVTRKRFMASKELHMNLEIDDPDYEPIRKFFTQWDIDNPQYDYLKHFKKNGEVKANFCVFRRACRGGYIHELPGVHAQLQKLLIKALTDTNGKEPVIGQCLATGEMTHIARLHVPHIKLGKDNVGLTTQNIPSALSWGREQGYNSPVGVLASNKYCTALKYLIDNEDSHCKVEGVTFALYATENTSMKAIIKRIISGAHVDNKPVDGDKETQDKALWEQMRANLLAMETGNCPHDLGSPDTMFSILALTGKPGRGTVEDFSTISIGEYAKRIGQFYEDLRIVKEWPTDSEYPSIYQLLRTTESHTDPEPGEKRKRVPVGVSKRLARLMVETVKAFANDLPYPDMILNKVLDRIRSRGAVKYLHAALLKAILNRNYAMELPMSLDANHPQPAYHLGRLFSTFVKIQEDALPNIKLTLVRFMFMASDTPADIFPNLLINSKTDHQRLLTEGTQVFYDKLIQEIISTMSDKGWCGYPTVMTEVERGLFGVGYYEQRQEFFRKKGNEQESVMQEEAPTNSVA